MTLRWRGARPVLGLAAAVLGCAASMARAQEPPARAPTSQGAVVTPAATLGADDLRLLTAQATSASEERAAARQALMNWFRPAGDATPTAQAQDRVIEYLELLVGAEMPLPPRQPSGHASALWADDDYRRANLPPSLKLKRTPGSTIRAADEAAYRQARAEAPNRMRRQMVEHLKLVQLWLQQPEVETRREAVGLAVRAARWAVQPYRRVENGPLAVAICEAFVVPYVDVLTEAQSSDDSQESALKRVADYARLAGDAEAEARGWRRLLLWKGIRESEVTYAQQRLVALLPNLEDARLRAEIRAALRGLPVDEPTAPAAKTPAASQPSR